MKHVPPITGCPLTWRELYTAGHFFQRELAGPSALNTAAKARGYRAVLSGDSVWRASDRAGSLSPLAFSLTPYFSGMSAPAIDPSQMVFADEIAQPAYWAQFAVDVDGFADPMPKYSLWQALLFPYVFEAEEPMQAAFTPLLKVLVRLQNRYLPFVRGSMNVLTDLDGSTRAPDGVGFDAPAVLEELGLTTETVAETYYWLAFRGGDDFADEFSILRQAVPRRRREKFKGQPRRDQDYLDAAEVFRRFYSDITGKVLEDPDIVRREFAVPSAMQDEQERRNDALGRPTRIRYDAEDVRHILLSLGLYPHHVHAVVEGPSEANIVSVVVASLLGDAAAEDVTITDLEGVGNVNRAEALLDTIADYATASVLMLDNEGAAAKVVDRLIADGTVSEDDVLLLDKNLEEDNFTIDELLDAARRLASQDGGELTLSAAELEAFHERQVQSGQKDLQGLASCIVKQARDPKHGAVQISKPKLAEFLAGDLVEELAGATTPEARQALFERRPSLRFVIERVVERLAVQPWDRPIRRPRTGPQDG